MNCLTLVALFGVVSLAYSSTFHAEGHYRGGQAYQGGAFDYRRDYGYRNPYDRYYNQRHGYYEPDYYEPRHYGFDNVGHKPLYRKAHNSFGKRYACKLSHKLSHHGFGPRFLQCSSRHKHAVHPHGHGDHFKCFIRPNRRYYEEGGYGVQAHAGFGKVSRVARRGGYLVHDDPYAGVGYAGVGARKLTYGRERAYGDEFGHGRRAFGYRREYGYGRRHYGRFGYGGRGFYGGFGRRHHRGHHGYGYGRRGYGYQYRRGYYGPRERITCYRGGHNHYGEPMLCTSIDKFEYVCTAKKGHGHGHKIHRIPFGLKDVGLHHRHGHHGKGQKGNKCRRQCEHKNVKGHKVKICSVTCCKWYCPPQACYDAYCCKEKHRGDKHATHHCLKKLDSCLGACYIKREEYDEVNNRYVWREEFGNRKNTERAKAHNIFQGFVKYNGDSANKRDEHKGNLNLANDPFYDDF